VSKKDERKRERVLCAGLVSQEHRLNGLHSSSRGTVGVWTDGTRHGEATSQEFCNWSVVPRGGVFWGVQAHTYTPPPRNSEGPPKSCQNQPDCENLKMAEFRTPSPQDVRKKGSKILKLPPVRVCFTLAMTNKLVVIINSLKVPKVKKIYYMKWTFLYQITAASRTSA